MIKILGSRQPRSSPSLLLIPRGIKPSGDWGSPDYRKSLSELAPLTLGGPRTPPLFERRGTGGRIRFGAKPPILDPSPGSEDPGEALERILYSPLKGIPSPNRVTTRGVLADTHWYVPSHPTSGAIPLLYLGRSVAPDNNRIVPGRLGGMGKDQDRLQEGDRRPL